MRRAPSAPLSLDAYKPEPTVWELAQAHGAEMRKRKVQSGNPYRNSFRKFLYECVWTVDRAMAGQVRAWPIDGAWDAYWSDWETALLGCGRLFVDKTRRTMASNVICAFDLWIASGGTDPRWEALTFSSANRSVLIQAQKMGRSQQDEGCSAEFVARIATMHQAMLDKGLKEKWPEFPDWQWGFGWGNASNGGKILAIPEGPGQVRGAGTTLLHMEELGEWEQAQATCSTALPALFPHGHVCAVTTPVVGSYAQRIRNGEISTGHVGAAKMPEPPKTQRLPLVNKGDWTVLEIRGARDIPGYNPAEVGIGMPPQDFRREVLGDWTASSGKVVFEEYGDIHEPLEALPFDPSRDLVCGWDLPAATGGTPAFVASQISGTGQWCIYGSLLPGPDETVGVWEFAERVAKWLTETFAEPCNLRLQDLKLVHYGDPAGAQRPLAGGPKAEIYSAYEIIRNGDRIETGLDPFTREPVYQERKGWGWSIQPGEVSSIKRIECVRSRLCANVRGAPAVVLSPKATFLREAFRGGYCLSPETPILHSDLIWRPIGEVKVGDELWGFDEFAIDGQKRRFRPSVVESVDWRRTETRRLVTERSEVITTDNHLWATHNIGQARGWVLADRLQPGKSVLRQIDLSEERFEESDDYKRGYLCGMTLGDGCIRYTPGQRSVPITCYWQVQLKASDHETIGRLASYAASLGVKATSYYRKWDDILSLRAGALQSVERMHNLLNGGEETREFKRGWLAGFFDAEGCGSDQHLRVYQNDREPLDRFVRYAREFGVVFDVTQRISRPGCHLATMRGTSLDRMRFFAAVRPCQWRKLNLFGVQSLAYPDKLEASERAPVRDVVDIQTSARTFYAKGLATHNCFKQRADGNYELDPQKNRHSHVAEALQYACSRLFLQHPEEDPRAKAAAARKRAEPAGRTAGGRGRR